LRENALSRAKRHLNSIIAKLVIIAVVTLNGLWVWALGWSVWRGLRAIAGAN
jgi:hypothetical protein